MQKSQDTVGVFETVPEHTNTEPVKYNEQRAIL